jgi:cytochrome c oxidase subunit 2
MPIAIAVILLVIGSLLFHFLSPWQLTPIASNWGSMDTTIELTFWVTGIVFVACNLFMAWAIIRYRHKPGQKAKYEPENKKLEVWLTVLTTIGVFAMLAPGLIVWANFVEVPEDATSFEAIGQQWNWNFRLPGEDGELGKIDNRFINVKNPFGLDPEDKNGLDDVLVSGRDMHLPIDQPVRALLRSNDVLHNFTVPQFRVKMDLVPGLVSYIWFTPIRTGTFEILCEELCGMAHFTMRGRVVVDEPDDYQIWLATQPTFGETQAEPAGDPAAGQAQYAVCAACHGMEGEGNQLLNAPKLAGQEPWYLKTQLTYYKEGVRGTHQDDIYGQQMAPLAATLATPASLNNVIAYIGTLPDNPAPVTIQGDPDKGEWLYRTCASCHGKEGLGVWTVGGPRQAGMSDWYLASQLKNFKLGIRGAHPQDKLGQQMTFMAKTLHDDEAINDVIAYINTL